LGCRNQEWELPVVDDQAEFERENREAVKRMVADPKMTELTRAWFDLSFRHRYPYNFKWMGMPIIQYPQDIVAMQELIWEVQPEVIVEVGIARGGSIVFYASLLKLLGGDREVIGVDIDIRQHNRERIERHPMFSHISLIEGSSVDAGTVASVEKAVLGRKPVMVILDSNHTHEHVAAELDLYAGLVGVGSYLVVFDTHCEFLPQDLLSDRPWGTGNSPYTAVQAFLEKDKRFVRVPVEDKLQLSCAPSGYLTRVA
jgi:cephalosporin hydroxylase